MNFKEMDDAIRKELSKDRYEHTIRVYETAKILAKIYGEPLEDVKVAALLHDYAKCQSETRLREQIEKYHLPQNLLQYNKELWHAPVGAMIAKEKFGVTKSTILHAIYYHTTGRKNMSTLELVIFVADYIEPRRNFPGVEEVRSLAKLDLKLAARKALQNTIVFLLRKDATVYPDTFLAYNELTNTLRSDK